MGGMQDYIAKQLIQAQTELEKNCSEVTVLTMQQWLNEHNISIESEDIEEWIAGSGQEQAPAALASLQREHQG